MRRLGGREETRANLKNNLKSAQNMFDIPLYEWNLANGYKTFGVCACDLPRYFLWNLQTTTAHNLQTGYEFLSLTRPDCKLVMWLDVDGMQGESRCTLYETHIMWGAALHRWFWASMQGWKVFEQQARAEGAWAPAPLTHEAQSALLSRQFLFFLFFY